MDCRQNPSAPTLNMRILLTILFVFVPSFASKEHVPLRNLPEYEKDILFQLVKRLGQNSDYEYGLGWSEKAHSLSECTVSTNTSSIIKRIDSENNGAKFLTLHEEIETNEACSNLCCKNKTCDLAVYENKGEHHCYLFQCEGKCLFGHHSSYISNRIGRLPPQKQQLPSAAEGSEQDLINLDQDHDSDTNVGVGIDKDHGSFPPTTTAASATQAPTPALYIRAHSVGLEGPMCLQSQHCEDPNAVCNYHKCRCREGYYQKGHICRKNCAPSEFGCLELGTLGRGPECVSKSQVCDSVMQCADGSDEYNCPESGAPPLAPWKQQQQQQQQHIPAAQQTQQQQQQQPSLPQQQQQQQQQQSYPAGYNDPGFGYSEQGMMAGSRPQGDVGSSFQTFPEGQRYNQGGDGSSGGYAGYNSQPQQPYMFPASDQSGPGKPPANAYPPGADGKFKNAAYEQHTGEGMQKTVSEGSGTPQQQQPGPAPQQQQQQQAAEAAQQPYQKPAPSQAQPPVSSGHQTADGQRMYPQQVPQNQNRRPQQAGPIAYPQQSRPESGEGSQQSYGQPSQASSAQQQPVEPPASEQSLFNQQPVEPPASEQSRFNQQPPSYHPVGPQQGPASSRVKGGAEQTQEPPSNAAVKSDSSGPYRQAESSQAGKNKAFMEGGSQSVDPAAHRLPTVKQGSAPENIPPRSDSQSAASSVPSPERPHSAEKSAARGPEGRKPAQTFPDTIHNQKPYVDAGQSKVQSHGHSAYPLAHQAHVDAEPEPLHPHSAYDVRIGEAGTDRQQTHPGQQPSFFNPTELNSLDTQGSSRYLDTFGNQYLPGQGYGQQYNQYGRYPSAYSQNLGNQVGAGGYGGLSEQQYPGNQGQRVYPQQGYLDLGYQSPQYEFGELDPAYSETDGLPSSHDVASSYIPGSKLAYDGPYKTGGGPVKNNKSPLQGGSTGKLSGNPEAKPDTLSKGDSQVPKPDGGGVSGPDNNQDKSMAQQAPSSSDSEDGGNNNNDSNQSAEDNKQTPQKAAEKDSPAKTLPTEEVVKAHGFPKDDSSDLAKDSAGTHAQTGFDKGGGSDSSDLIQSQNAFISRSKLDLTKEIANMQGPIIALSLGLAFTVILLVFVACRLRTVRRRLRKGRLLHSNEADYLINGMYL